MLGWQCWVGECAQFRSFIQCQGERDKRIAALESEQVAYQQREKGLGYFYHYLYHPGWSCRPSAVLRQRAHRPVMPALARLADERQSFASGYK